MRKTKQKIHGQTWKTVFAVLAIFAWTAIPFLTQNTVEASGSDDPPVSTLTANLTAPGGARNPHGEAVYEVYANGNRELEVEVEDVNVANGTIFTVLINNASVGQITVNLQKGKLKLRTENGQNIPNIVVGTTVAVKNGAATIVSGTFGGGNATPSPTTSPSPSVSPTPSSSPTSSPTASPSPTTSPSPTASPSPSAGDLFAALRGATLNGALPNGFAQYEIRDSRRELEIRVRQVSLPSGTSLAVLVDNVSVGQLILERGEGRLRLRSDNGQTVPNVVAGSTIAIKNGAATILSGTFAGAAATPSPSPSPTAQQGKYFEANLNGLNVTPPVSTRGRGEIKIVLNAGETEAQVFGEFENLSSAQTSAKIFAAIGTTALVFDLGTVGGREGRFAPRSFAVTAMQVQQLRAGVWFAVIATQNNPNGETQGQLTNRSNRSDFDGDGRNDFAVYRPSTGIWFSIGSGDGGFSATQFGTAEDKPVAGDFDGDGRNDLAVYRPSNGVWYWLRSSDGGFSATQFGTAEDKPLSADFDGDGRSDLAVYRPSSGVWYLIRSGDNGFSATQFGTPEDKPVAGDFDGDGKADLSVYRPSSGVWYWLRSSDGGFAATQFGTAEDKPMVGDFDGDGKSDLSVYRPSNGFWYIYRSSDGAFDFRQFGSSEDVPAAGNYDGDGKTDIAVFRPSNGTWFTWRSVDNALNLRQFGERGDVPTASP